MNREEAILRELNLYPLWQRRGQATSVLEQVVVTAQPMIEPVASKSVMEKADLQNLDSCNWA